jgi:hypothetical protein
MRSALTHLGDASIPTSKPYSIRPRKIRADFDGRINIVNSFMNLNRIGDCTGCIRKSVQVSIFLASALLFNALTIHSRTLFLLMLPLAVASAALSLAHLSVFSYRIGKKKLADQRIADGMSPSRRSLVKSMVQVGSVAAASMAVSAISPRLAYALDSICGRSSGQAINCGNNICCYDNQENEYFCCPQRTYCVGPTSTSRRGCRAW